MVSKQLLLSCVLPWLSAVHRVSAAPAAMEANHTQAGSVFKLFVWGNGIPGWRLFYADGAAVFSSDENASETDNLVPLTFNVTRRLDRVSQGVGLGYSFSASPDPLAPVANAATRSPPFGSALLFVGAHGSPQAHDVGFVSGSGSAGIRLGGFMIVEQEFAVVEDTARVHLASFCAFPSAANPDVWQLKWNVTNDDAARADGVPVRLRTNKPAKGIAPPTGLGTECRTTL